jgi:hypothetical protein
MSSLRCAGRWCETPNDDVVLLVGSTPQKSLPLCRSCRDAFDSISEFLNSIPTWDNTPEARAQAEAQLEELQRQQKEKNERFRNAFNPPPNARPGNSGRPMPQMRRYRKGTADRPLGKDR